MDRPPVKPREVNAYLARLRDLYDRRRDRTRFRASSNLIEPKAEPPARLEVMPPELETMQYEYLSIVPVAGENRGLFIPMGPWALPPHAPIPVRVEQLKVVPREVPQRIHFGIESGPLQNLLHVPEFPYPVGLEMIPLEVITLWLQIVELYGFVGYAN